MLAPISWRTPPRHYGPWEQVTSLLTEALVARGVDVTLFATLDSRTAARLDGMCPAPYSEDPSIDAKVWETALGGRARYRGDFACEAFAQELIHHQLGLDLTSNRCGVHDGVGRPSLLARNNVENFGRNRRVVAVAADRDDMRHDLFPKRSELLRIPGSNHASERTSQVRQLAVSKEIERYTWVYSVC